MARIRSVILCDDIRREENGKELLIGVYTGGIRFNGPGPGKLRQLFFRIGLEQGGEQLESTLSLELTSPSGARLINVPDRKITMTKDGRGAVAIAHLDLVMYEEGAYTINVVVDGELFRDTVNVSFETAGEAAKMS